MDKAAIQARQAAKRQQTLDMRAQNVNNTILEKRWTDKDIEIFGMAPDTFLEGALTFGFAPAAGTIGKRLGKYAVESFATSGAKDVFGYTDPVFGMGSKQRPEGTALTKANRNKSNIPKGSKLLSRTRYSEVYRDPKGKIHVWGRPTVSPFSALSKPYSVAREWNENIKRGILRSKYNRSDPIRKDMKNIRKKYGKADYIAGYSRGARYGKLQPYSKDTEYDIWGPYTHGNDVDSRIKINYEKGDFIHNIFAKKINHPLRSVNKKKRFFLSTNYDIKL
jgi:hypothetical protein